MNDNRAPYLKKTRWIFTAHGLLFIFAGVFIGLSQQPVREAIRQKIPFIGKVVNKSASEQDALMQIAAAQARHFKGSPDAPVTILEFSDFQ